MKEIVDQIVSRLKDQGVEVPRGEIESRLRLLVETFRVPESEARRSVLNYFLKESGIAPTRGFAGGSQALNIGEIAESGRWVDLKAKVVQLWESNSDSISQTGLIGDGTGVVKFVKWAKAELPDVEEGKSYLFKNVVTDEFQGRFSVKLNRTSQIQPLEEDVEVVSSPLQRSPVQELSIGEIAESGRWVDLKAKVVQLWESNSDSISQTGLIGDETGVVKFVKWTKAELPDVEEGKSYLFKNVVTDEFQGRFSVKLNRTSQIQPLEEDVVVSSQSAQFSGAIVDIQKGSGLIKRCPVCRRSLAKGICGEHGKVEGIYDLRIKAVIDDGTRVQDILINRETTEALMGLTLEEAKRIAMEALDHEVILGLIEERLMGRYYTVAGPRIDRYLLVESMQEMLPIKGTEVEELIRQVEVI